MASAVATVATGNSNSVYLTLSWHHHTTAQSIKIHVSLYLTPRRPPSTKVPNMCIECHLPSRSADI